MTLSEKESEVFWPLYDELEKKDINLFNRRVAHFKRIKQEHKNLSDNTAKELMNEFLQIEADALKTKRELVKKFSKKLPPKTVYRFFVYEELLEAGFFGQIAERFPPIE
jgi:hypothetical protein